MVHLALYRKYRPQTFEEVRGQDQAVAYLQSIIDSERIPHALLFTGSRGIGKTTLARIFVKTIGIHPHDVYEIDAASNNSVDDVRTLINEVNTLPLSSKYKVYILDEVHMFSKAAFNALLKVLEEPPQHVLFVFATTELHKVIPTIISRCQVVRLKKPTDAIIAEQIISVTKSEGKSIEQSEALLIAKRASGSFRDALVILDQILEQVSGDVITKDSIEKVGIRIMDSLAFDFLDAFSQKKTETLLEIIKKVTEYNNESIDDFLEKIIQSMRMSLYIRYAPSLWKTAREDISSDYVELLQNCSDKEIITPKTLAYFLQVYDETKKTNIPQVPIELAIIGIFGNLSSGK